MNNATAHDPASTPETIRLYHFAAKRWAIKVLWERRLKITRYDELNDPFELLPFELAGAADRRFWERRLDEVRGGDHGVVCFSASWRNPRMWAHYGERHTGICLGFDVLRSHAEPVRYVDRPLPDPRLHDRAAARRLGPAALEAALRHKPRFWQDEEEWRVRAPLADRHDGIAYLRLDAGIELREVILGARCTLQPVDVVEAVSSPPLDVEIYSTRAARNGFAIERHEEIETHRIGGFQAALARAPDAYWHELRDEEGHGDERRAAGDAGS